MSTPQKYSLKDYAPHPFTIENIFLTVTLSPQRTHVKAESHVTIREIGQDFILDGHSMELLSIKIDDHIVTKDQYRLDDQTLTILKEALPRNKEFTLTIETYCNPTENTSLDGLYCSGSIYCTQCEAQGFRKITYYIDRPDNMAIFKVKLIGDQSTPTLLSNGNLLEKGVTDTGKPYALWHDPFKKPSYLFAMVAGDLGVYKDHFITLSGRHVALEIYTEHGNEEKCAYAMDSLKRSMKWDEEAYGREYDLDLFMIVAVADFNFGAMENKGLNIFNAKYILADSLTATDTDYENIEAIVAHEYFHNWTGNRITCRDWFQLCLKEGLTVFRDQTFSADMRDHATKRISDVQTLRHVQFSEDGGPLAHAVRPDSFIEINNFYTVTVYEKGAELCHMLYEILGKEGFRKGTDLYFERYDGMAVTVEDFISALSDANNIDLSQFFRWYIQAGTPRLKWDMHIQDHSVTLTVSQKTYPTPNQAEKKPFYIPIKLAFIDADGKEVSSEHQGQNAHEHMIFLKEEKQSYIFNNVPANATLSFLRNFTAPVIVDTPTSLRDQLHLLAYDSDPFNRYDAGQNAVKTALMAHYQGDDIRDNMASYCEGVRNVILDPNLDPLFKTTILSLPSVGYVMQGLTQVLPQKLASSYYALKEMIANALYDDMLTLYHDSFSSAVYDPSPKEAGRRAFNNMLLSYMAHSTREIDKNLLDQHYHNHNMTDQMGVLSSLSHKAEPIFWAYMQKFYDTYSDNQLVLDKWFSLQARRFKSNIVQDIQKLVTHKSFNYKNPNRIRSVLSVFCHANIGGFHCKESYDFIVDQILKIDTLNPKVASGLATAFENIQLLQDDLKQDAHLALSRIMNEKEKISNDVYEIIAKII